VCCSGTAAGARAVSRGACRDPYPITNGGTFTLAGDLAIKRMHSFVSVEPGETTGCVGGQAVSGLAYSSPVARNSCWTFAVTALSVTDVKVISPGAIEAVLTHSKPLGTRTTPWM